METTPDPMHRIHLLILALILIVYVTMGVLYAVFIPTWQVPDEPAHYNYVRSLAEGNGIPVMEPGDYDQAYLSQLTAEDFPPELPIDRVEYEDHQPPLYYLLAVPVYWLFGGAVVPLRLLSVACGAALLLVVYRTVGQIFPRRPRLPLMATAFVAFIPQHVAMTAGVENDALGELLLAAALWRLVIYVGGERQRAWPIGVLLGMGLLTKTTTSYPAVGVALVAVAIRWRRERRALGWAAGQLAGMFVPALVVSAPWFIRNGLVYGWNDPTGLMRHNQVVVGQLRTSEFLALYGWPAYWKRAWRFTFHSFWGQLGWMEVVLPARVYQLLGLLTVGLVASFGWWLFRRDRTPLSPAQRAKMLLLLALFGLVLFQYVAYNLTFVQHQGRYLFPALIPLGVVAGLGLGQWAELLPSRLRAWAIGAFFAGMAALDVYVLFKSIPYLEPG